jgi:hypothetical protein
MMPSLMPAIGCVPHVLFVQVLVTHLFGLTPQSAGTMH